jgi:hypothetical protein
MIYELVSDKLLPPHEFHIEYPSLVELALTTGYFQFLAEIGRSGHFLHIHEEYEFSEYRLSIQAYVYILFDKGKDTIIRADSLPHHRIDHKGHSLSHFPNHLYDERGRICSFNGRIEDFVKRSSAILENKSQG